MEIIREALKVAAIIFSDMEEEEKRKLLLDIAMDLWDVIDPLPNVELDDQIIEIVMRYLIDWIVDTVEAVKN